MIHKIEQATINIKLVNLDLKALIGEFQSNELLQKKILSLESARTDVETLFS